MDPHGSNNRRLTENPENEKTLHGIQMVQKSSILQMGTCG